MLYFKGSVYQSDTHGEKFVEDTTQSKALYKEV